MSAQELAALGIHVRGYSQGNQKVKCPQCSHTRKNKSDPCLSVTITADGFVYRCHNCDWSGGSKQREEREVVPLRQVKRPKPDADPQHPEWMYNFFESRKISKATVDHFGIYVSKRKFGDAWDETIVFPYVRKGELVNRKYRTRDKRFQQDGQAERTLFNIDSLEGESEAIFVEGEMDVLAFFEAGMPNAVTLPDGAPKSVGEQNEKRYEALTNCALDLAHIEKFVLAGDLDGPGKAHTEELARRLGKEKCWRVRWCDSDDKTDERFRKDANDVLLHDGAKVIRECTFAAEAYPIAGLYLAADFGDSVISLFRSGRERGLSTGWRDMDSHLMIRAGDLTVVTGIPNAGKALALETPVPMDGGWKSMGELEVGDDLFDENGNPCKVTHAFDVMYGRPCFEITFSDGTRITADADHQWITRSERARISANNTRLKRGGRSETLVRGTDQRHKKTLPSPITTRQIAETLWVKDRANHAVAVAKPVQIINSVLPIHPYVLGAWLGDGSSAHGGITSADPALIEFICGYGYKVKKWGGQYAYGIQALQKELRALVLLNNKRIPAIYLRSSEECRLLLLQGLMDTDGYCDTKGRAEFCTTSEKLAVGTYELVASLGMVPTMGTGRATLYGKDCGPKYRICFTPNKPVFQLKRKLKRQKISSKASRTAFRKIVSVVPVPSVPVRCITVDSPSHQFLVSRAFIPTHNSEVIDALMVNMARLHDWKFAICSFENAPDEHLAKLSEKFAHAPFWDGPTMRMDESLLVAAQEWLNEHFLFIRSDEESPTLDWILERAKAAVMRYGIRGLVIDPWNEIDHMRPPGLTETEYVSQILSKIRRFAKVSGVHVWIVAHPAKMQTENGKTPIPGLYDISGSAHFANKADFGIVVHRGKDYITEIHIKKVRHKWLGQRGIVKLRYKPATGEYSDDLEALL